MNGLDDVKDWTKAHPKGAAVAAGGGLAVLLIGASLLRGRSAKQSGASVPVDSAGYLNPDVLASTGGQGVITITGPYSPSPASPSLPVPYVPPPTSPTQPTPPPPEQTAPAAIPQLVRLNGALFDTSIVGGGFTNRSTDAAYRGQGWAPTTTGGVHAPSPDAELVGGQWVGNTLVAGTYVLPDGSRVRVTS